MGAPREGRPRRLEQVAALEAEPRADGADRGFNPFLAPLRKALERRGQLPAQRAGRRGLERRGGRGLEGGPRGEERLELARQVRQRREIAAHRLEQPLEVRARERAGALPAGTPPPSPRAARRRRGAARARSPSAACRGRRSSRSGPRAPARSTRAARRASGSRARRPGGSRAAPGSSGAPRAPRPRAASPPRPPPPPPPACSSWCGRGSG